MSRYLAKNNDMTVLYMAGSDITGNTGSIKYHGFVEDQAETVLCDELSGDTFDIYHIWGTEYRHSFCCMKWLKENGLSGKSVVSIQGLIHVYERFYYEGLSNDTIKKRIRIGLIRSRSIEDDHNDFSRNSDLEKQCISMAENVIGRTDWDKKSVLCINPGIRYFKCNENLRECFYEGQWDINKIDRHTVFVSQCAYPVKGMHFILRALPIILKKYPDTKVITTGNDPTRDKCGVPYFYYLAELIDKLGLSGHIEFLGVLSAEQMKAQYLRSHVFLSASSIENSPNSVGEAMILGCPVVSSYVGGVMDMLEHRKEGLLFQPGSIETMAGFIMDIFSDDELAKTLSENERRRAFETHDVEKNNKDLISIYTGIRNLNDQK